jgi:hypothetical protein
MRPKTLIFADRWTTYNRIIRDNAFNPMDCVYVDCREKYLGVSGANVIVDNAYSRLFEEAKHYFIRNNCMIVEI